MRRDEEAGRENQESAEKGELQAAQVARDEQSIADDRKRQRLGFDTEFLESEPGDRDDQSREVY